MKPLILIILTFILFGCKPTPEENTIKAELWIKNAVKPIVCTKMSIFDDGYTLQSADYHFYPTGDITIALPDTIK